MIRMPAVHKEYWDVTEYLDQTEKAIQRAAEQHTKDPVSREETNEDGYTEVKNLNFKRYWGLYSESIELDYVAGRVTVTTSAHLILWIFSVLAVIWACLYILFTPNLFEKFIVFGDYNLIPVVLIGGFSVFPLNVVFEPAFDMSGRGKLLSWFSNPYPAVAVFGLLFILFYRLSLLFSTWVSIAIGGLLISGAVLALLSAWYIPSSSSDSVSKLWIIPCRAVYYRVLPFIGLIFIALGPVSLISGYDVSPVIVRNLGRVRDPVGMASIISEVTAGMEGSNMVATLYFLLSPLLVATVVLVLFLTLSELSNSGTLRYRLLYSEVTPIKSRFVQIVSAFMYLISNIVVIFLSAFSGVILVYAVTDQVLLPSQSVDLLVPEVFSRFETYPELIVRGSLIAVENGFRSYPGLSPRAYALLFYCLFFLPLVLIVGAWIWHLLSMYRRKRIIDNLELLDQDLIDSEVLLMPGNEVDARHVSRRFGISTSILVTQGMVDALDDAELEAVLRHEEYHMKNRDTVTNIIATVLSLGFGGRNSLLAFYGYPGIEEEADRYAVEKTSQEDLGGAIEKAMEKSLAQRSEEGNLDTSLLQGFYQFYFGEYLFSTAHRGYRDRQDVVYNFEDSG